MGQAKSVDVSVRLRDALFTRDIETIHKLMSTTPGWERGVTYTHFVYALSIRGDPNILRRITNVVPDPDRAACAALAALQGKEEALRLLLPRLTTEQKATLSDLVQVVVDSGSTEIVTMVLKDIGPRSDDISALVCATRRSMRENNTTVLRLILPYYNMTPSMLDRVLRLIPEGAPAGVREVLMEAAQPMRHGNATLRPLAAQRRAKAFLYATSHGVLPDESTKSEVCSYIY